MALRRFLRLLKGVAFIGVLLVIFDIGLRVFTGRSLNASPLYMWGMAALFSVGLAYLVNWGLARRAERRGKSE